MQNKNEINVFYKHLLQNKNQIIQRTILLIRWKVGIQMSNKTTKKINFDLILHKNS